MAGDSVKVGGALLDFEIHVDAIRVGSRGWERGPRDGAEPWLETGAALKAGYAAAVEREMAQATPDLRWRGPRRGLAATGGGIAPIEDVIVLVLGACMALTAAAGIFNTWVTFGKHLRTAWKGIGERFGAQPHVASGTAMLLAAAELHDKTGSDDFSVAFSVAVGSHPSIEWGPDAFAVGFRGANELWIVLVDLDGTIRDTVRAPLPGQLPEWWLEHEELESE